MRKPCCTIGYGGTNPPLPWHIVWLPKGYGPTEGDRFVCAFAEPENEAWDVYHGEEYPPLIRAVCDALEKFARENPDALMGRLELVRKDGELVKNDAR